MIDTENPRIRINAKQTSKGLFYFDATVEYRDVIIKTPSSNPDELGEQGSIHIVDRLFEIVEKAQARAKSGGHELVG